MPKVRDAVVDCRDLCLGGADQAFHNVLFYRSMLPGARAVANGRGQVYTVGIFGKFGMALLQDKDGYVVNEDQKVRSTAESGQ